MASSDFDQIIVKTHRALEEFYKGNPSPYNQLFSSRADVSLAGAFGGVSLGQMDAVGHATNRASFFREGHDVRFESLVKYSNGDFGFTFEVERFKAVIGGTGEPIRVALRATTIYRRENGEWKVVHRIGDPLVAKIDPATYRSLAKRNEEMEIQPKGQP